jgi:hypothetical protein
MKINEFIRSIEVWRSDEEQGMLDTINGPTPINSFNEREQAIIEGLVRKSLLIKVSGKNSNFYVYPNA